jgi:hypothetical protein
MRHPRFQPWVRALPFFHSNRLTRSMLDLTTSITSVITYCQQLQTLQKHAIVKSQGAKLAPVNLMA